MYNYKYGRIPPTQKFLNDLLEKLARFTSENIPESLYIDGKGHLDNINIIDQLIIMCLYYVNKNNASFESKSVEEGLFIILDGLAGLAQSNEVGYQFEKLMRGFIQYHREVYEENQIEQIMVIYEQHDQRLQIIQILMR